MSDERPVVSFDHHTASFAADPWSVYKDLRERCPVAWSDTYGGFWVLSKYEDIKAVALDDQSWSSAESIVIPPKLIMHRSIPIETDPPIFHEYRRIMNPFFTPSAIQALEPAIGRFIHQCIDSFISDGACDIVSQFADVVPAMTTLQMLGLDPETWPIYAEPLHIIVFHRQDSEKRKGVMPAFQRMKQEVVAAVEERKRRPRDDMISRILQAKVFDRPITDEEATEMIDLTLQGGFDTTAAGIGNALIHLDRDRAARERLIADPSLIQEAVEEFLRWEAPVQGLARTAKTDCVIRGQQIRAGEKVFLLWASGNHDEDVFDRPDEVVLDRFPNKHMTFGLGAHRCLGSTAARLEMRHALRAVLERIPDYEISHDKIVTAETIGVVYGHFSIPITFTPGKRRDAASAAG